MTTAATPELRATLVGLLAILIWSSLALFAVLAGPVPPFQLVAMAFTVVFAVAFLRWILRGENPLDHMHLPLPVWALGITGLFGYHFFYFLGVQNAPPAEANLINYLWPVLIVLFANLLPAEAGVGRLRWHHIAGAGAGLLGTVVLIGGGSADDGGGLTFRAEYAGGYLAALAAAITWAGYSVTSRRIAHISTDSIGAFCGATAALAWIAHGVLEPTVWPGDPVSWLAVLSLGLGPVGLAFFFWDHGVKHGNLRVLGAAAYLAPLLSTIGLVVLGFAAASLPLALACALIVGGGLLAAKDMFRRSA
ncbi:MAG: EamA family transporter [Alphaproteobacteria bacterium]|nr:EamA family transporter [Alphaproteobacteria bacterium]